VGHRYGRLEWGQRKLLNLNGGGGVHKIMPYLIMVVDDRLVIVAKVLEILGCMSTAGEAGFLFRIDYLFFEVRLRG